MNNQKVLPYQIQLDSQTIVYTTNPVYNGNMELFSASNPGKTQWFIAHMIDCSGSQLTKDQIKARVDFITKSSAAQTEAAFAPILKSAFYQDYLIGLYNVPSGESLQKLISQRAIIDDSKCIDLLFYLLKSYQQFVLNNEPHTDFR